MLIATFRLMFQRGGDTNWGDKRTKERKSQCVSLVRKLHDTFFTFVLQLQTEAYTYGVSHLDLNRV